MRFIARHGGEEISVEVERHGGSYRVRIGDRWLVADLVSAGRYLRSLRLADGTQLSIVHDRQGTVHTIALPDSTLHVEIIDPLSLRRTRSEDQIAAEGTVRAPMPGRIARVMVSKGEAVRKGTGLLVLEAMKMENEIQAPLDGIVESVSVEAGQTVEGGAELVIIAPLSS